MNPNDTIEKTHETETKTKTPETDRWDSPSTWGSKGTWSEHAPSSKEGAQK